MNANVKQPLAGRGEPDWRALSSAALDVEGAACDLVDTFDNAERVDLANKVQQAVELIREVRRQCDASAFAHVTRAHLRWTREDDDRLRATYGETLRSFRGDTERTCDSLARTFGRSPVAIAARLCHLGLWRV